MKKTLFKTILHMSFYVLWVIRITTIPLLIATGTAWADGQTLNTMKVSMQANNMPLDDVLEMIEQKTDFRFYYTSKNLPLDKKVTVVAKRQSLRKVLMSICEQAHVDFRKIENNIYVQNSKVIIQKHDQIYQDTEESVALTNKNISGIVKDAKTGEPLIGATVIVKGTNIGVATNVNGEYTLSVPEDAQVLIFSYTGYLRQEVEIINQSTINVALSEDVNGLKEIVVVGYGTQEKSDLTGSVSGVKEESFNGGVITSPEQLFLGKIPGVRIVNSSGEPGAGIDVFIRGAGSIRSGNAPLFVVDGVPLTNDPTSAAGQDVGFGTSRPQNPLNFLNPSDIESIDVLKDASAAAIYGARGSNGVVLITTKKARTNQGLLSYDNYVGISNVSKKLDLLSGSEYAAANPSGVYDNNVNTDWQDEIFRTAITHNHNLALGQVLGRSSYRASLSYLNQEGIIENSDLERISARLNTSNSFFNEDRLQVNLNLFISQIKKSGVPTSDGSGSGGEMITNTLRANPTYPVRDENGEFFAFPSSSNPIAMLSVYSDDTQTLRFLGNLDASLKLVGALKYKFNLGLDKSVSERNTTVDKTNLFDVIAEPDGFYGQSNFENGSVLVENLLTYDINSPQFDLTLLAGHAYQKFNVRGTNFSVANFSTSEIDPENNPNIGTIINPPTGFAQENELQSFFARANFDYQGKYLLTASLRADGSTRFGENNQYGYFPSFAVAWRVSNESFWSSNFLTNLKLRLSWGQTGNQEVPNKVTQASFASSSGAGGWLSNGEELTNGITLARTANPDLRWEVVSQTDIGLDFEVLEGRFYGTVDWFNKVAEDVLVQVPSRAPAPTSTVWTNIDGKIKNSGLEVMLGGIVIDQVNFRWSTDMNITYLNNQVEDLDVSEIITGGLSGPGLSGAAVNIITNGESLGSFLLFKHLGFDENGANILQDTNNDGLVTNEDRIIAGDALPNFILGFNNYFAYKKWDLSFSLIGEFGAKLYNNTANAFFNVPQFFNGNNVPQDVINTGEAQSNTPAVSTFFLEDADFLRLNNLTLGYNFNTSKIDWLGSLRLYATAQNLFVITDYSGFDPSVNTNKAIGGNTSYGIDFASYPLARTFLTGLNISF